MSVSSPYGPTPEELEQLYMQQMAEGIYAPRFNPSQGYGIPPVHESVQELFGPTPDYMANQRAQMTMGDPESFSTDALVAMDPAIRQAMAQAYTDAEGDPVETLNFLGTDDIQDELGAQLLQRPWDELTRQYGEDLPDVIWSSASATGEDMSEDEEADWRAGVIRDQIVPALLEDAYAKSVPSLQQNTGELDWILERNDARPISGDQFPGFEGIAFPDQDGGAGQGAAEGAQPGPTLPDAVWQEAERFGYDPQQLMAQGLDPDEIMVGLAESPEHLAQMREAAMGQLRQVDVQDAAAERTDIDAQTRAMGENQRRAAGERERQEQQATEAAQAEDDGGGDGGPGLMDYIGGLAARSLGHEPTGEQREAGIGDALSSIGGAVLGNPWAEDRDDRLPGYALALEDMIGGASNFLREDAPSGVAEWWRSKHDGETNLERFRRPGGDEEDDPARRRFNAVQQQLAQQYAQRLQPRRPDPRGAIRAETARRIGRF